MRKRGKNIETAKNFKNTLIRLLKNLSPWKITISFSLILAMISAILALLAPSKLTKFTDTLSEGLVPDVEVLKEIGTTISLNLTKEENLSKINQAIIQTDLKESEIKQIKNVFEKLNSQESKGKELQILLTLPNNVLEFILDDIKIKDVIISSKEQVEILNLVVKMGKETKTEKALGLIDKLPVKVYNLIKPKIDMDKIKYLTIFMASLYLISSIFNYIKSLLLTTSSNKFANLLRKKISIKINKLPLKYFDNNETGDVLSRITNDVDTVAMELNDSLATLVSSTTLFIGALFMMFITNWVMAFSAIISSLLGFSIIFLILIKSQKYFVEKQEQLGEINSYIEEIYSGHNVVSAYNGTEESIKEFGKLNKKLYVANRKSQFLSGLMPPIMGFVANFGYVMVCIVGALLTMKGYISFGVIVAFMIYIRMFTNQLTQIAQAMSILQTTTAASERVFEFLDEREIIEESNIKNYINKSSIKGKIQFKNVNFGYDPGRTIIKDFSVDVKPSQKIAIVGPTGAGKTTMVNLLMKFYEINKGSILIDDVSISELSRENIHDLFIMVLQDTWLFNGSIRDNVKFNKENVSDIEIWKALKTVGIDHFIKTLPGGLDYIIGDNDTISQGQKQLLTIARGMVKDAPLLILDEATSNVDTRTEELVQKAMDKLTEGRTSFIIAHRLSTIKNADIILVMKDGNIIEQGNHEELINKKGFYAELYNSQFEI